MKTNMETLFTGALASAIAAAPVTGFAASTQAGGRGAFGIPARGDNPVLQAVKVNINPRTK
jgi:hypothetical protein